MAPAEHRLAMARIVVADDDVDIRDLVMFKLATLGHEIVTVCDGRAAVDAWVAGGRRLDPVVRAARVISHGSRGYHPRVLRDALDVERAA